MGWFDKLIRGTKSGQPAPAPRPPAVPTPTHPETGETPVEYARRILLSEDAQNETFPPDHRGPMLAGSVGDTVPGGDGEFGRSPANPVPVNGFWGEKIYLSLLRLPSGERVLSHRLGSVEGGIDIFELASADGRHRDTLYLHMYHPRRSRRAPDGYTLVEPEWPVLFSSTASRLDNFPADLPADILDWTMNKLGVPLRATEVVDAVTKYSWTGVAPQPAGWEAARRALLRITGRVEHLIESELGLPMTKGNEIPAFAIAALTLFDRVPRDEGEDSSIKANFTAMMANDYLRGALSLDETQALLDDRYNCYTQLMAQAFFDGGDRAAALRYMLLQCIALMTADGVEQLGGDHRRVEAAALDVERHIEAIQPAPGPAPR